MAVTVKKISLWRRDVENHPGALADALQPLSEAGSDLQIVMAYRYAGDEENGAVEVFPVSEKKQTAVAQASGFSRSSIPVLLVERRQPPRTRSRDHRGAW